MALQEKKLIGDKIKPEKSEKPFQWGDEINPPDVTSEVKDDGQTYTSVEELLKDEEKKEKTRIEEYFTKIVQTKTPKK